MRMLAFSSRSPLRSASPGAGAPPASKSANYVVGPQDVLNVTVFNEPQLSGRFRVENDGQFTYPFLGRMQAGGTSVAEIAALMTTGLANGYLRNPQVNVDVEQFRSQNVFVMGEVRAPGRYTLTGSVTLIEALAQAGSTAPTAGGDSARSCGRRSRTPRDRRRFRERRRR